MRPKMRTEADRDLAFAGWITDLAGAENIRQCIQCGACSGNCPLAQYMDLSPRQIVHLAKEGFKEDVLGSETIWLCTSCYGCTVECPRGIKVTDIMYALKRRAIDDGLYPKRYPIPILAREFRKMVRDRGRISEARLVAKLLWASRPVRLGGMTKLGLGLLRTGRLSFKREKVRDSESLRRVLDAVQPPRSVA